jgi:thymidylate synthase
MYMRSTDIFLGLPFNIASYALLLKILAHLSGLEAAELIVSFGDLHLYRNHFNQAAEQLSRTARELPTVTIDKQVDSLENLHPGHILLEGYHPHPAIKAEVAV